jgi:RNA ligase (TIGR02306 family)
MSTFRVTVEKLTVREHPNADALELAQVGLFSAVIPKGVYQDGDYALYIPEQAVLPPYLIEELGLSGKLAGKDKNRVKAVRLRGALSQGIVCRPSKLQQMWDAYEDIAANPPLSQYGPYESQHDYAELLGITKWVPPVPVGMAGEVEPAPELIRWGDIENIKRYPGMFVPGELVVATEKVHGTCCLVTYTQPSDQVFVSSKGQGSKSLAILPSDTNVYWRAVRRHNLADAARQLSEVTGAKTVAFFGEVYGAGVQDLHYGAAATHDDTLGYALFDAALSFGADVLYLSANERAAWALEAPLFEAVPRVPVLYNGPYDYGWLTALAEGMETVSGTEAHLREGLVVRPAVERRSEATGGRCIAKFIGEAYLTRGGPATEYE